jgi:sugar phosphate isomerase/epimerase
MLYLALSCLQGRPALQACRDLRALGAGGIQLTPGNVPDPALPAELTDVPVRTHHGFSWKAMKQRVWDDSGRCRVTADSVHPPTDREPAFESWWQALRESSGSAIYETMYPGYRLGNGEEIERAMDEGLSLAVDVSHVHIQRSSGAMTPDTWRRLQRYAAIAELHVSDNSGRIDSHRPLTLATFGLGWAKERASTGIPLVLECYMHRLCDTERRNQVELLST